MRRFVSYGPGFVVLLACVVSLLVVPRLMRMHAVETTRARITLAQHQIGQDDILARIDRATAAIADAVEPSVVHIETTVGGRRTLSSGAGWILDTEGHVVTNAHVVRNTGNISVEFYDGRVCRAELIGTDPFTDIAVLELECDGPFFPVARADGRVLRKGERVFAFGSPFGFKFSMSEGIVSGLGREPGTPGENSFTNYIQTDAAVNPGNSGGPLVDVAGELIGMNVAIATARNNGGALDDEDSGDSAGISFAIPLGTIVPIVNQIIEHGSVERGFMGISFGNPNNRSDDAVRRFTSMDGRLISGIQVFGVTEDGPSARAGMQAGDVITNIDGYPVLGQSALRTLISSKRPGEDLDVRVYRDGESEAFKVTLARMPQETLAGVAGQRIEGELGARFMTVESGVMVRWVWGERAIEAGLEQGQVIERVEGERVRNQSEFYARLLDARVHEGQPARLTVRTGPEDDAPRQELTIDLSR